MNNRAQHPPAIALLLTQPTVHLIGSRRLGIAHGQSDWDLICEESQFKSLVGLLAALGAFLSFRRYVEPWPELKRGPGTAGLIDELGEVSLMSVSGSDGEETDARYERALATFSLREILGLRAAMMTKFAWWKVPFYYHLGVLSRQDVVDRLTYDTRCDAADSAAIRLITTTGPWYVLKQPKSADGAPSSANRRMYVMYVNGYIIDTLGPLSAVSAHAHADITAAVLGLRLSYTLSPCSPGDRSWRRSKPLASSQMFLSAETAPGAPPPSLALDDYAARWPAVIMQISQHAKR